MTLGLTTVPCLGALSVSKAIALPRFLRTLGNTCKYLKKKQYKNKGKRNVISHNKRIV